MRLNSGNLVEFLGRNEDVLESANFAQIFFEDFEESGKTAIFCADNDIGKRKNEFVKRVKKLFPENIIGCKKLRNKDIVVLTSRSVLNVLDPKDFSVKKSIQCDYFATSLCSYIYGDSLDSLQIFIGSVEGDLIEWKLENENKQPIRRKGHKGMIFAISADSQNVFTISDDRTLRMWKIAEENREDSGCLCTVYGHTARPFSICVDEKNQMIFTGGIEQTIFVWKYSGNSIELVRKIGLSIGTIRSIVQIENLKLLVGSYEGALVTVNISPIEKSFEICKNVQNFAYLSEKLVILDDSNNLTVFKNEKMTKILFRAENIRYLTSDSNSNSIAAWNNEKFVIFMNENNVLSLKMSSNVISIIVSGCYFLVKLVDGFVRLYSLTDSQNLKYLKKFKLAKPSMIPSKFIIIDDFLIFGTTHGELYYIQISSQENPENVIKNRKIEKSLFGDKEISKIRRIEDTEDQGIFMVLAKNGTWSTFQLKPEDEEICLLNSRSFSANMRITWPCEFLEIFDRNYIVGFHGTSLVIWDTIRGISCFEIYCGGGNREWKMRENETNELYFDYLSHGILRRQKIDLEMIEYSADIPHSSSIVSASGSRNYLATVSLDGILSISSELSGNSSNFEIDFSMFAGENLLSVDIFESENPAEIWVITGGGKSTFGIWKFRGGNFERNIFWHRNYCEDSDEGRVVAVKFVEKNQGEFGQEFVVSFSSGAIFTFSIENNEIIEKNRIRLDENVGIGAKIEIRKSEGETYEILVGTSGSYLICYRINGKNVEKIWQKRLDDRSGVTALCLSTKSEIIIGFDSGNVITSLSTSSSSDPSSFQILHKHLSTVVGIVEKDSNIYSVSLDCQIKNNNGKTENTRINMPNGMTKTDNCIIVIGDGLETF